MFRRLGSLIGTIADTPWQTRSAAVCACVAFGLAEFSIHVSLLRMGTPRSVDAFLNSSVGGALFGCWLWFLLTAIHERRAHVREELQRIAEVNHEIRNALQIIADSQFDTEARHRAMVLESVGRIDVVLSRVFPVRPH